MSGAPNSGPRTAEGADDGDERPRPEFLAGPALLIVAFLALAASATMFIPDGVLAQFAGYALAAPIVFSAIAVNRRAIVRSAAGGRGGTSGVVTSVAVAVLLAGFALALAHAWLIARHYG